MLCTTLSVIRKERCLKSQYHYSIPMENISEAQRQEVFGTSVGKIGHHSARHIQVARGCFSLVFFFPTHNYLLFVVCFILFFVVCFKQEALNRWLCVKALCNGSHVVAFVWGGYFVFFLKKIALLHTK